MMWGSLFAALILIKRFQAAIITDLNAGYSVPGVSRGRRGASFSAPAVSSSSMLVEHIHGSWYFEFWINHCHIVHI